ncbi:MAG: acyl-CoA thioesterase [Bacteroidetes bacterium]|nr:acyl-CoA thioesterase [Bacteroidota bacterium]MBU1113688.1 acyl-CoA thioesterase [Bacteroidota bacterium]MBU1799093.1 acyl-CoA thioesterase [Bacteroidota bacterium]
MDEKMDLTTFHHSIKEKVKFHEVDFMKVVNNAVYFNYFEDARVKYLQDLKAKYNLSEIMTEDSFFIMAHNEIDYLFPAIFDDELIVYTKIEWIKNTSFSFKHIILNEKDGETIAIGGGIFVHIKLSTKEKQNLPLSLISAIQDFEKGVLKKG